MLRIHEAGGLCLYSKLNCKAQLLWDVGDKCGSCHDVNLQVCVHVIRGLHSARSDLPASVHYWPALTLHLSIEFGALSHASSTRIDASFDLPGIKS